jgi:hypothetical protein
VTRDDEHNVFELRFEDRVAGYPRRIRSVVDFIASGEYRTLRRLPRDPGPPFPVVVKAGAPRATSVPRDEAPPRTSDGDWRRRSTSDGAAAEPRNRS